METDLEELNVRCYLFTEASETLDSSDDNCISFEQLCSSI